MPHCAQADLEKRYGERELIQLTDQDGVGFVDTERLNEAIADADEEINGYLADAGYALPLTSTPYRLKRHACAITRWFLYDEIVPDQVQKEYDKAIGWLERIVSGKVSLHDEPEPESGVGRPAVKARAQVYTNELMKTY